MPDETKGKKPLTAKQERFCQEYLKCLNATRAAIKSGYSAANADKIGSNLVRKSRVTARLKELQAARSRRYEISAERILEELAKLAFSDITDYVSFNESGVRLKESSDLNPKQRAAILEVSEVLNQHGGTTKFKLHDKVKALELLGKYQKLFTDKHEHSGEISGTGVQVILSMPSNGSEVPKKEN